MIYLTHKGIKFISEATMTRGAQMQRIALKHLELRKDPKRAKAVRALRDRYAQLESFETVRKGLGWLLTKAKGHDLPPVSSQKLTPKEKAEAYKTFKTTAGGGQA